MNESEDNAKRFALSSGFGWSISTLRTDACQFRLKSCVDFTQFITNVELIGTRSSSFLATKSRFLWLYILPTENRQMEHANACNTRFSIFVSVRKNMVLLGETG